MCILHVTWNSRTKNKKKQKKNKEKRGRYKPLDSVVLSVY